MNEELKNQAEDVGRCPEGEFPASVPFRSFEHKGKIVRGQYGYLAERMTTNSETKAKESYFEQISDFWMDVLRIEHFMDDVQTVQRVIRIINPQKNFSKEVAAHPKDMVGKYNFCVWLLSQGDFNFQGTEADLERIRSIMFDGTAEEVTLRNIMGHDLQTGHFLVDNGAISKDGKIALFDPQKGYTRIGNVNYRLVTNDRDEKVKRAPTLNFDVGQDKSVALFRRVIKNTEALWGPGTEIGWGWFLSILWRSKWIEHTEQFPLLFVTGNPSIGKTQFIKNCALKLYGITTESPSIAKLTEVGLFNLTNSMCDIPLFLDEFKSEMLENPKVMEMLKGNADNASKIVGSTDAHRTVTRTHRTGLVVCGESRPSDEALSSRNVSADLVKIDNRQLFDATVRDCRDLSCVLVALLQQWDAYWPLILDRHYVLLDDWRKATKLDSRIITNYAKVCATMDVILPDETRRDRFFKAMEVKGEEMEDKNPLANLLKVLPYLLQEKKAFIPCIVNVKKRYLAVNASFLTTRCSEFYRSPISNHRDLIRNGKAASLLIPSHKDTPHQVEIEDRRDNKRVKTNSRCFLFDMSHPLVKEVAEFLVDQTTPKSDSYPTEAYNPDDPFMPR